MLVHITDWDEPERVAFDLKSETDPVNGDGWLRRLPSRATDETSVELRLRIDSTGPMAGMMESMAKPVLARMQKSFAKSITEDIEQQGS